LFSNILVTVIGQESGWHTVEQAIEIARREDGQLLGLHVVPTEDEKASESIRAMQAEFTHRCEMAGVPGEWTVEAGSVASRIQDLSRWISLTLVNLAHPPDDRPMARLSSGFRTLIQTCPTPILAVPQAFSSMNRALLAYDGSPKADEALYVSTYLAGQWGIALTVLTVAETETAASVTLTRAQEYLHEHAVEASFVKARGAVGKTVLRTAREHQSELIVMGGYGFSPVLQIALGSAVDQVLRESRQPTLICR
jgi:nucleotide-binding universal stress UspA family protein